MELLTQTHVAFFVIVAAGIALGRLKIKGISLDLSAVIFVALFFGHLGVRMPEILQKVGLILFMFSVGIQAGPGFFESFRKSGKILIALAFVVIASGALMTLLMAWIYDIDYKMAVGLFTGALTSTSGLAAAVESTHSPATSIGFGIAYPFGIIGVILFARLSPKIFKIDVPAEERRFEAEIQSDNPPLVSRNFVVENPNIFGKTLQEIDLRGLTRTTISRIVKQGEIVRAEATTRLEQGDRVRAVGTQDNLKRLTYLIGRETSEEIPLRGKNTVRRFLVTNKEVINKSLRTLALLQNYNATVTTIRRSGIDISPRATSKLRFGDKLIVTLPEENAGRIGELLGDSRKKMNELDFLPIALGILLGILLGEISIPLFSGIDLKLGLTGGVLISALVLSKIGKTGSIVWNVSGSANMFLRKLGLIMFLAVIGTHAGEHLAETIQTSGLKYFISGVAITLVPMILSVVLGYYILKMNFLSLIGSLTGSMTSTPALSAVEPITDTNAPQIAYATVYPFALVLLIIVSQLLGGL